MRRSFDTDFKVKIAKAAIDARGGGGLIRDIAEISGVHLSIVNRWVKEFEAGKLAANEIPLKKNESLLAELQSINRTIKKIYRLMKDQVGIPGALIDLVAGEMNGENNKNQEGGGQMATNIEQGYQEYKAACFAGETLSATQDAELRRAFFAGAGWLYGELLKMADDEERTMEFFDDIVQEMTAFVSLVKLEIH